MNFAISVTPPDADRLDAARAAGFTQVELPAWEGTPQDTGAHIRSLQTLLRDRRLRVAGVHAGWDLLDATKPSQLPGLIGRDIAYAAHFGAPVLVIHYSMFVEPARLILDPAGKPHARETVDRDLIEWTPMLSKIRRDFAACVDQARRANVRIALETEVANSHRLLDFMTGADPAWCGVCFDTGHAQVDSDAGPLAEMLASRVIYAHIHDNTGKEDEHLPPGRGVIDWPRVLRALRKARFTGPFTYEPIGWDAHLAADASKTLTAIWDAIGQGG